MIPGDIDVLVQDLSCHLPHGADAEKADEGFAVFVDVEAFEDDADGFGWEWDLSAIGGVALYVCLLVCMLGAPIVGGVHTVVVGHGYGHVVLVVLG